jgi:hypothetical protein
MAKSKFSIRERVLIAGSAILIISFCTLEILFKRNKDSEYREFEF